MAKVFVSIGSNIDRERHIGAALDALVRFFGPLDISSVYESEAVGFDGDNFFNLVAAFETPLPVGELSVLLKKIEDENGRCRQGPKFSGRTLDIDILTYDQLCGLIDGVQLPREEIRYNAFVLQPLAELVPSECHPEDKVPYAEMWGAYDRSLQLLWTVPFAWQRVNLPASVNG